MQSEQQRLRDNFLLETNFDEDGALTMVHTPNRNNNIDSNLGTSDMRNRLPYRSNMSVDRYSDTTLHGVRSSGNCCQSCVTRIPYATLIATVMCLIGVGIFCGTMYRGTRLTIIMFDTVFRLRLAWIDAVQIIFVIVGASMAAVGFMILFVGCLATGATRHKVYRAWGSRVGGRISCAVFMGITYILKLIWMVILCFLAIVVFAFVIFWNMCSNPDVAEKHSNCIELSQFYFLFPQGQREEDMNVCEAHEVKAFCKDGVEAAVPMFILALMACLLIILSLVHYLMCLAANYAHIRDHEKFQELQEMHNLTELEFQSSKERF